MDRLVCVGPVHSHPKKKPALSEESRALGWELRGDGFQFFDHVQVAVVRHFEDIAGTQCRRGIHINIRKQIVQQIRRRAVTGLLDPASILVEALVMPAFVESIIAIEVLELLDASTRSIDCLGAVDGEVPHVTIGADSNLFIVNDHYSPDTTDSDGIADPEIEFPREDVGSRNTARVHQLVQNIEIVKLRCIQQPVTSGEAR